MKKEGNIMRHYRVNVNGTSYEIAIEEISADEAKKAASAPAPAPAPAAAPAAAAPAAAAPAAAASVPANATTISAPMPGNILAVNVSVGSDVKRGDILMILEAMKMENEIMAPKDGKVTAVNVQKGATVNTGDLLCVIG